MPAKTPPTPVARTRTAALLAAFSGALLVVALTPGTADAAVRTSNGKTCTIVGTKGRDVLKGTARRDVICGRGGNDVINGKGGNDVIDGGAGNDKLTGAGGSDELLGGAGSDRLSGSSGNDRLTGGRGNDRLSGSTGDDRADGGAGDDVVDGAAGNDSVTGGAGNDRLAAGAGTDTAGGGAGNDAVSGGAGDDDVSGGDGSDRVAGGPGADNGNGGPGSDVVLGETGDDTLGGGSGQDSVDGGPGFNLCDTPTDNNDRQIRCAIDTQRPVIRGISLSRTTVDVSRRAQSVTVSADVTDDTGVAEVGLDNSLARRVSGTARHGVWQWTIEVPANYRPGEREIPVYVLDRVGRAGASQPPAILTVDNTVLDQAMPVVRSFKLDRTTVDARADEQWIWATVRITDDLAGVGDPVVVCPSHAFPTGAPAFRQAGGCSVLTKVSGTLRDSTFRGAFIVPAGADGGTWNADVVISDASATHGSETWWGPNSYIANQSDDPTGPTLRALPNGAGAFRVIGRSPDTQAPKLTSVRMSPSTVDTTHGARLVTLDVAGTDAEGISDVRLFVGGYPDGGTADDYLGIASVYSLDLVRGTATNGVWRATFVVPGGTPNGRYHVGVSLQDRAHYETWTSGDGWEGSHPLGAALAPTGTHLVVANSP